MLSELFLAQIPEAIYFSLFIIKSKGIKEKRVLFILLITLEFILLTRFFIYNIWFQILYTFMTFIILKILYKEKTQIIDIFLFACASIFLMIISGICALIQIYFNIDHSLLLILNRIIIFLFIFLFKNNLHKYYNIFCKYWNRHNEKRKIKSLTLRNISIIAFNLMFYILNIGLTYIILTSK